MKKRNSTFNAIVVAFFLLLAGYGTYNTLKDKKELDLSHRYTVGKVIKHMYLARSSQQVYYTFEFNEVKYESMTTGGQLENTVGKFYLVKFNPDNPDNSEILLKHEVPSKVKPPTQGWDKFPAKR